MDVKKVAAIAAATVSYIQRQKLRISLSEEDVNSWGAAGRVETTTAAAALRDRRVSQWVEIDRRKQGQKYETYHA